MGMRTDSADLLRAGLYYKIKLMTEGHPRLLAKGGKNIMCMSQKQLSLFITDTAEKARGEAHRGRSDDAKETMLEVYAAVHQFAHPGFCDDLGTGPSEEELENLTNERKSKLADALAEAKLVQEIEEEWDDSTIRGTKSDPAWKDWEVPSDEQAPPSDALEEHDEMKKRIMYSRVEENNALLKRIISEPRAESHLEGRMRLQTEESNVLLKRITNVLEVPKQHHHPIMGINEELDKGNILRGILSEFEHLGHGVEHAARIGMAKSRDDAALEGRGR
eukprot:g4116.t1